MFMIGPIARLARRFHRGERGQMLFMFLGITVIFFALGTVAIDASLWQGQRRTAQKDSDAVALAGGQELLNRTTQADITTRADAAAYEWATRNQVDLPKFKNSTPAVAGDDQTGCFGSPAFDGLPDSLSIDLGDKGSTLFSTFWNLAGADVGAHAKVCAGSPADAEGVLPVGIPVNSSDCFGPGPDGNMATTGDNVPLFGQKCKIEVRPASGFAPGNTGILDMADDNGLTCSPGGGNVNQTLQAQITRGAHTTCAIAPTGATSAGCPYTAANPAGIGKCVSPLTGNRIRRVVEGLQERLAQEGTPAPNPPSQTAFDCDALYPDTYFNTNSLDPLNGAPTYNNDKVDQWWEALSVVGQDIHTVTPGPDVTFERRTCTAPRLVTVVIIGQFTNGSSNPYPILGFAGFWISGCEDTNGVFNDHCVTRNCNNGCTNPKAEPELQNTGQLFLDGMFINFVDIGAHGGALNQFGRIQLFLVE